MWDLITPFRYADVSIYESSNGRQVGGIFSGAAWDMHNGTLTGSYTSPASAGLAPAELWLRCSEEGDHWSCSVTALSGDVTTIYTVDFKPDSN